IVAKHRLFRTRLQAFEVVQNAVRSGVCSLEDCHLELVPGELLQETAHGSKVSAEAGTEIAGRVDDQQAMQFLQLLTLRPGGAWTGEGSADQEHGGPQARQAGTHQRLLRIGGKPARRVGETPYRVHADCLPNRASNLP